MWNSLYLPYLCLSFHHVTSQPPSLHCKQSQRIQSHYNSSPSVQTHPCEYFLKPFSLNHIFPVVWWPDCTQYSKFSLTNILYNCNMMSQLLAYSDDECKQAICLLYHPSTCVATFRETCTCVPRCLFYDTPRTLPFTLYVLLWFIFQKCITSNWSELNSFCHSLIHFPNWSISRYNRYREPL